MSQASRPFKRPEKEPLWVLANEIAEYMYAILSQLPEEERWDTTSKIRATANNLLFYIAESIGSGGPTTMEYEWGDARKYAVALKTMYRFAGRQKFVEIEPEVMVKLDKCIDMIDSELQSAYEMTEKASQDELEIWRDRYRLWKEKTRDLS